MKSNQNDADPDRSGLRRRTVLSIGAGSIATFAGLGAFAGSAAAWDRLDAEFKGCSEVWLLVADADFEYDPPLVVNVIVADDDEAVCRPVEITEQNATTIPGQHGDSPLIKYSVAGGEKILGIIGASPTGNPLDCEFIENTHRCAQTPNTPSVYDADCYTDRSECSGTVDGPASGSADTHGNSGRFSHPSLPEAFGYDG